MWSLIVATAPDDKGYGDTVSLSEFHVEFEVQTAQMMVPWKLVATIYNVPEELRAKITQEYVEVALFGGYQHARYGQLFDGQITYFEHGKLNATDTFLRIYASKADIPHNQIIVNKTLPAGTTGRDLVNAVSAIMTPYGVTPGYITALEAMSDQKSARGRTIYGVPSEVLRDLTQTIDGSAFIDQYGKLNVLGPDDHLPGDPIEINVANGMVGIPAQHIGAAILRAVPAELPDHPGLPHQAEQPRHHQGDARGRRAGIGGDRRH